MGWLRSEKEYLEVLNRDDNRDCLLGVASLGLLDLSTKFNGRCLRCCLMGDVHKVVKSGFGLDNFFFNILI
mgnify:CR=1 FL=1